MGEWKNGHVCPSCGKKAAGSAPSGYLRCNRCGFAGWPDGHDRATGESEPARALPHVPGQRSLLSSPDARATVPARECGHPVRKPARGPVAALCDACKRAQGAGYMREYRQRGHSEWCTAAQRERESQAHEIGCDCRLRLPDKDGRIEPTFARSEDDERQRFHDALTAADAFADGGCQIEPLKALPGWPDFGPAYRDLAGIPRTDERKRAERWLDELDPGTAATIKASRQGWHPLPNGELRPEPGRRTPPLTTPDLTDGQAALADLMEQAPNAPDAEPRTAVVRGGSIFMMVPRPSSNVDVLAPVVFSTN